VMFTSVPDAPRNRFTASGRLNLSVLFPSILMMRSPVKKIVAHADHDADSAKQPLRVILQFIVFFRVHELAVRVQRIEHPFQRRINQLFVSQFVAVHIVFAHTFEHTNEHLDVLVNIVLFAGLGVTEVQAGTQEQVKSECGEEQTV